MQKIPIRMRQHDSTDEYISVCVDAIGCMLKEKLDISNNFPIFRGNDEILKKYFLSSFPRLGEYGLQYDANRIFELCDQEHGKYVEIMITSYDLYAPNLRFCYGQTRSMAISGNKFTKPIALMSHRRIDQWFPNYALKVWFKTCMHEFGHILGLVSREYNVEDSLGRHCIRRDCIMGQSNVERKVMLEDGRIETRFINALEVTKASQERFKRTGSYLCEDCQNELIQHKKFWLEKLFT
jgi:hypothetical protein